MRITNNAARKIVDKFIAEVGGNPIPFDVSYIEYASALRRRLVGEGMLPDFHDRPEAVSYVRTVARVLLDADKAAQLALRALPGTD